MDKQLCAIPAAFVPLNYLNDPETEDLIFGDKLVEDMVVLVEDHLCRADPDRYEATSPYTQQRIQKTSRWCRVADIRRSTEMVTFIGEYADGTKFKRSYNSSFAWYVKKASMPN